MHECRNIALFGLTLDYLVSRQAKWLAKLQIPSEQQASSAPSQPWGQEAVTASHTLNHYFFCLHMKVIHNLIWACLKTSKSSKPSARTEALVPFPAGPRCAHTGGDRWGPAAESALRWSETPGPCASPLSPAHGICLWLPATQPAPHH